MKSFAFPNMFNNSKTNILVDKAATMSNMKLILQTNYRSLFGDPGYGNDLQSAVFSVNNMVLADLVKDNIFTCLKRYIPQLVFNRDDISVTQSGTTLVVSITAYNNLTKDIDVYDIDLLSDGDEVEQASI